MQKMFSVLDVKAEFFAPPFVARTLGEAVRSFSMAAEDPQSPLAKNPDDYVLYYVADFDEQTCSIILADKQKLGSAADFQRKPNQ